MRKLYGIIAGLFFLVVFSVATVEATQMSSVSVSRGIETTISEYGSADVVDRDTVAGYLPYNHSVSTAFQQPTAGYPLLMVRRTRIPGSTW